MKRNQRSFAVGAGASLGLLLATGGSAVAQPAGAAPAPAAALESVLVTGQRERGKQTLSTAPEALPTQTYVIPRDKLEAQSFSDATDLLRSTPGITFGSSSPGGDIGDDISIRGFNGFHGAATAVYIDGVPVNWSHSGFGAHGTADFNWLTPELIERIEVIKGPFSALYGNFNLSGAINIVTRSADPSSVAIEGGSYSQYRAVGVYGKPFGDVVPFIAVESLYRGGYRERSDYRRANSFNKFTFPVADGRLSVRLNASVRDFNSGGFLLADDVRNGVVSRRAASPDSGGDRGRIEYLNAVANYVPTDERGPAATVYAGKERYRLADTSFGPPQAFYSSERSYGGARALQTFAWERALLTAGLEGQVARIENRNADTDGSGNPTLDTARNDVQDRSAGIFAQGQFKVLDSLKLVGGLRYDWFRTEVENFVFQNSGRASTSAVSPKLGVVFTPLREVELFANTGRGFRSPASNELSPNRANAPFNSSLDVAKLKSADVGVTLRPMGGLSLTAAYFTTDTERELRRDPVNPANVVNIGGTERKGYELVGEWAINQSFSVNGSHTKVDTKISEPATPGNVLVITVPKTTQTAAVSWRGSVQSGVKLNVDAFLQRTGRRPLAADGSLYDDARTVYGAKARLTRGSVSGFVQVDYVPEKFSSDFVYDLGSGPVYDPRPRLAVLLGVKYVF